MLHKDPDGGNETEFAALEAGIVHSGRLLYGNDIAICWSPHGTKLAFTRPESDSVSHLWVIDADGTGLTQVTSQPGAFDRSVTWGR